MALSQAIRSRMSVWQGNLVTLAVDAIVNAANTSLLGGGGVDGAIHRAAGPELVDECRMLNGCHVGDAKLTQGYRLPARHVIHTVGPRWLGGGKNEPALLASCYRRSCEIARDNGLATIAFPSISTGIYRYPLAAACAIATRTVAEFLGENALPARVTFCAFDDEASLALWEALAAL
jgi:O-acetyl-ADP-ribose deacetylase (regulator of RNase III)